MWPFKKKPGLIRDKYLSDNAINSKFADAFQRSKSKLKKDITELKKQSAMWKTRASKNHEQKKVKEKVIDRLDEKIKAASASGKLNITADLSKQLELETEHYAALTKDTLDIKTSSRSVCNTIGLLQSILSGTYTDPEILSDPPEPGWVGGWDELFADSRGGGKVPLEDLNELLASQGHDPIPSKKDESNPDEDGDEDSADPILDSV